MRTVLLIICGVLLLTFLEYRALGLIQHGNRDAQVEAALGVLSGHPFLKAFQNRLLGPFLAAGLAHLTRLSFLRAYQIIALGLLCLANAICFSLFRNAARQPETAWGYAVAYAFLVVALQDRVWLCLWDFIDLTTMMLFAWAVFTRPALWKFVVLFFVELLNRESAFFIALWMMLDSVALASAQTGKRPRIIVEGRQAATGILLMIAGLAWTQFIREKLFVHGVMAVIPQVRTLGGQFWILPHTRQVLDMAPRSDALVAPVMLGLVLFLLRQAWTRLGAQAWKVCVLICVLLGSTFMFAVITETRVWFELVPFLLWLAFVTNSKSASTHLASEGAS